MDANAVVLELFHNNIIDRGDERRIAANTNPTQQNQYLHLILKEKCTEDAFETVCDIITAVKGNPKMKVLGESMKRRLETGGYMCVGTCGCVCVWECCVQCAQMCVLLNILTNHCSVLLFLLCSSTLFRPALSTVILQLPKQSYHC